MSMEYYAQVVAPIINASATLVLVIATGAYVWLTKRVVDESIHQNRPYVFLRLDESGDRRDLKLVNTGNRVARDICIEIVRDASISVNIFSSKAPTTETHSLISDLAISRDGVPTLPAGRRHDGGIHQASQGRPVGSKTGIYPWLPRRYRPRIPGELDSPLLVVKVKLQDWLLAKGGVRRELEMLVFEDHAIGALRPPKS